MQIAHFNINVTYVSLFLLGIGMEGIGCILAGAFGSASGTTSYSENIGAIGITKVEININFAVYEEPYGHILLFMHCFNIMK